MPARKPGLPSWPELLSPHTHRVPSDCRARECDPPAAMATQCLSKLPGLPVTICSGAVRLMVVPSPSWPLALSPQAQSVPSACSARVWKSPAATADQVFAAEIRCRCLAVAVRAVAELAVRVVPPAPEGPVRLQGHGMAPAGRLGDPVGRLADHGGRGVLLSRYCPPTGRSRYPPNSRGSR